MQRVGYPSLDKPMRRTRPWQCRTDWQALVGQDISVQVSRLTRGKQLTRGLQLASWPSWAAPFNQRHCMNTGQLEQSSVIAGAAASATAQQAAWCLVSS